MNTLPVVVYVVTSAMSANTFGLYQIKALVAKGFQVHLVCGDGKIQNELNDYCTKIHSFRQLKRDVALLGDSVSLLKLFFLLRRIRPHVIIYSTPKASLLSSIASFFSVIKVRVYQIWGLRWQNYNGLRLNLFITIERLILNLSTSSTGVSNSIKTILDAKIKNNNVLVLGSGSTSGINNNYFFFKPRLNKKKENFKIGYAGRITGEKGVEKLLNLFKSISSEVDGLELEIIGDVDGSQEYSSKFQESIKYSSNVKWIKEIGQEELGIKMQNWDLQVFLSEREGLGNVILEAGACGVPTFCWNIAGTIDAIPSNMKRFLIQYDDINLMRNSIIEYIKSPLLLDERDKLSKWYLQNFEQSKVLQNFVNYINGLVGVSVEK
jgi:glycosyltransferase involved in cell wall biosynthesis